MIKGLILAISAFVVLGVFAFYTHLDDVSSTLLLVMCWCVVLLAIFYLCGEYMDNATCTKCNTPFKWSDPNIKNSKNDKAEPCDVSWEAVNGEKTRMQERVKYKMWYFHNCPKCNHVDECRTWLEETKWENRGDPFIVKSCPFCKGKGFNDVHVDDNFKLGWDSNTGLKLDYLQSRTGQSKCAFCDHRGWVKPGKLKDLIAE